MSSIFSLFLCIVEVHLKYFYTYIIVRCEVVKNNYMIIMNVNEKLQFLHKQGEFIFSEIS